MKLSLVFPIFNEESIIIELVDRLCTLISTSDVNLLWEIIFVDDGSEDESNNIIRNEKARLSSLNCDVVVIKLARNFGHQLAPTAGIDKATGDYVAILDADLQDPPELVVDMLKKALEGHDVVYAKRRKRANETIFKKYSAAMFYRLLRLLSDTEIPLDTGDFRIMSRRFVDELKKLRERHRFIRGLVPWIGFSQVAYEYDRAPRYAGETKYPLRKMISFALNAIMSFSIKPVRLAMYIGFFIALLSFTFAMFILYLRFFTDYLIPGQATALTIVTFLGGIQIIFIGIIGEYVGKIFEEIKARPIYVIEEIIE